MVKVTEIQIITEQHHTTNMELILLPLQKLYCILAELRKQSWLGAVILSERFRFYLQIQQPTYN